MSAQDRQRDSQREAALDQAVERVHAAYLVVKGTANAPTRDSVRESITTILEWMHHPDYVEQQYFHLGGGAIIRIERHHRHWDNFQIFVPATDNMIWFKDKEPQ